ncbi:DUF1242 domain-containing protein [Tubulinosema ratisbonensis]|uniref:Protein kish n=1 Tax=Tubulinosema ratisbonensis TaxID=291195 RepID=A0A437ALI4_9MICR|nr:DUF1242 domain-containing protein [Tubulinosema ratisbonensis]
MSALFNFTALLRTIVLVICTATFLKKKFPSMVNKDGKLGTISYKASIVGERLSPYVAILCFYFGLLKLKSIFF